MKFLNRFKDSIWIIPVMHSVASILLALVIVYFNYYILPNLPFKIPFFLQTSMDLARTILWVISSALLTMTTITFSTIMVVLTTYSSQYSPRVLKDFVSDPKTLHVLGIFMGGFLYAIMSLAFLQETTFGGEVISAIVGVMISIACLFVFVYFVQHVASSIQIINLINALDKDISYEIEREEKLFAREEVQVLHKEPMIRVYLNTYDVTVSRNGYIQYLNLLGVFRWASTNDAFVEINHKMGSFLTEDEVIYKVHSNSEITAFDELNATYILGKERTIANNPDYAIQKMVDVTMRALSPSTYDPFTVNQCLDYLAVAMRERFRETGHFIVLKDEAVRVIAQRTPVKRELYDVFGQIHYYIREETTVYIKLLQVYTLIGDASPDYIKGDIKELVIHLNGVFNEEILEPLDLEYVNVEREKLNEVLEA